MIYKLRSQITYICSGESCGWRRPKKLRATSHESNRSADQTNL